MLLWLLLTVESDFILTTMWYIISIGYSIEHFLPISLS